MRVKSEKEAVRTFSYTIEDEDDDDGDVDGGSESCC